jgi:cell division protein FtsI/penicillin-binding protein 2
LNLNDFILSSQEDIRIQTENNPADNSYNKTDISLMEKGNVKSSEYNIDNIISNTDNEASKNSENKNYEDSKFLLAVVKTASKIWLAGVILLIAYILIITSIMNYRITKSSISIGNNNIQDILDDCKKLQNIKKDIPIIYQQHIKTPAICGVLKVKMVIPIDICNQLGTDEIKYVILHELCHFKHKDTLIGMIKMLLCIPHWFNPLVWYALKKMKDDKEPVCDEMVLTYIKPDERRNYAETLIKIIKCFSENHWAYSTANMSQGNINNMEWRLKLMNILKKRSVVLGIVIALVTVTIGVAGVLFINNHLSFTLPVNADKESPAKPADENPIAAIKDELPTRGKIFDRNGKELAISIPANIIVLNPKEIKASGQDTGAIAETLAGFLSMEKEKVLEKITASSAIEIIRKKVDKDTGDKLKEWIKNNNIKGIIINKDSIRVYPNNNLAAHVIGFTGFDNQGLGGIENSMEGYLKLKGTDVSVNGNKTLAGGNNITLTIDTEIQRIVENALDKAIKEYKVINGATAIIMDPKSGEILAMSSKPDYNLNMPYSAPSGVDSGTWKGDTPEDVKILADTVWKNKSLSDTYEPASTFKAITSVMALEENIIHPDSKVNDFSVEVDKYTIYCWRKHKPHGEESFEEAVYNSCNPVFVRLAQNLGIDKFYSYIRNFGFYETTGLELPGEEKSLISEKQIEINMATASIGQRLHVTPIQLAMAYSAIANDGKLMKPQIIKKLADYDNSNEKNFEPQGREKCYIQRNGWYYEKAFGRYRFQSFYRHCRKCI